NRVETPGRHGQNIRQSAAHGYVCERARRRSAPHEPCFGPICPSSIAPVRSARTLQKAPAFAENPPAKHAPAENTSSENASSENAVRASAPRLHAANAGWPQLGRSFDHAAQRLGVEWLFYNHVGQSFDAVAQLLIEQSARGENKA